MPSPQPSGGSEPGRASDSDTPIRLTVDLDAPPPRVFKALTDPHDLKVWVWGGMGRDAEAEADLRVGGRYRVTITTDVAHGWPRSQWSMRGLYVEIAPPTRLVYTVHWDAPVGYNEDADSHGSVVDELVVIDLAERNGATVLHYAHFGVPNAAAAAAHKDAIQHTLELLRALVASRRQ
ncbi:MAG: SRPBCC domain-containing protein [Phycisphaerales bacterium]